jgi:hypothetical protein
LSPPQPRPRRATIRESTPLNRELSPHANPELRIVIEARDDTGACGRKRISDDLAEAMKTRNAVYGLYVSKKQAGLAREIGDPAAVRIER